MFTFNPTLDLFYYCSYFLIRMILRGPAPPGQRPVQSDSRHFRILCATLVLNIEWVFWRDATQSAVISDL